MTSPFQPHLDSINYLALNNDFDPPPFLNLYKTSVLFDDGLRRLRSGRNRRTTTPIRHHRAGHRRPRPGVQRNSRQHLGPQLRVLRLPGARAVCRQMAGTRTPASIQRLTSHMDWAPTLLTDALGCDDTRSTNTAPARRCSATNDTDRVLPIEQWTQRAIRTEFTRLRVSVVGRIRGARFRLRADRRSGERECAQEGI